MAEFLPSGIEWWLIAQALQFAPAQCPFLLFFEKRAFPDAAGVRRSTGFRGK
jgi:hypothetical protein